VQRCGVDNSYQIIASRHGICGVDYDANESDGYQDAANEVFLQTLQGVLEKGHVYLVPDRFSYARAGRDGFKALVESHRARCGPGLLQDPELLWQRDRKRRDERVNADSPLNMSRQLFNQYITGFEHPLGEGVIIVYTQRPTFRT
ncbi:hypothetical protein DOTSEDRAFT_140388, partial [Dothistroma septosporum NZE10]